LAQANRAVARGGIFHDTWGAARVAI